MAEKMTFGATLRFERMYLNLSLKAFADKLGVASSYLCDIEYDRRVPSKDAILKMVKELVPGGIIHARRELFDDLLEKSGRMSVERRALLALGPAGAGLSDEEIEEALWGELSDGE